MKTIILIAIMGILVFLIPFLTAGMPSLSDESVIKPKIKSYWSKTNDGSLFPTKLSDKVGVGTTTPSQKLVVAGNQIVSQRLTVGSTVAPESTLHIQGNSQTPILTVADYDGFPNIEVEGALDAEDLLIKMGDVDGEAYATRFDIDVSGEKFLFNGGNVGIGTSYPEAKLEVKGGMYLGDVTSGVPEGEAVDVLQLRTLWNPGILFAPQEDPLAFARMWYDNSAHELYFDVSDGYYNHRFIFDGHGVFIADSIKSNGLSIASIFAALNSGTINEPAFRRGDNGMFFPGTDDVAFSSNGVQRMIIDSTGNVGIGTDTPEAKLHVNGDLSVNGNLMVDGCICYDNGATCLGSCT